MRAKRFGYLGVAAICAWATVGNIAAGSFWWSALALFDTIILIYFAFEDAT
jgi:hypothetical protein